VSVFFYVFAQREIDAAQTGAYYAIASFIGVALSFLMRGERPDLLFGIAMLLMIIGTWFASKIDGRSYFFYPKDFVNRLFLLEIEKKHTKNALCFEEMLYLCRPIIIKKS
jgi:hypothetical protein